MGGVAGNLDFVISLLHKTIAIGNACLVAQALRCNDSNLVAYFLVGLEIEGELRIVPPRQSVVSNKAVSKQSWHTQ